MTQKPCYSVYFSKISQRDTRANSHPADRSLAIMESYSQCGAIRSRYEMKWGLSYPGGIKREKELEGKAALMG
jgi:hypothetical protein